MRTALICVLVAGLMPYLWTTVAKVAGPRYDNRNVREWQSRLTGMAQRANAAHLNSFEAFPLFAVGVLAAHATGVDPNLVARLAMAFVAARLLYGAAYLANLAALRSLIWFSGLGFVLALFYFAIAASTR